MKKPWLIVLVIFLCVCILAVFAMCIAASFGLIVWGGSQASSQGVTPSGSHGSFPPPIPGLTYADLQAHLEKLMLTCSPMSVDGASYSARCEGQVLDVDAYSYIEIYSTDNPDEIYLIIASVEQPGDEPSDKAAGIILGYIATLRYTSAQPSTAYTWVADHISDRGTPNTTIAGVQYHLISLNPALRILVIGERMND